MTRLSSRGRMVIGTLVAAFLLPSIVALVRGDFFRQCFRFLAPDTFYYLTVARHVAETGRFSFDGEHPTNGFHPLWQVLTALNAVVCRVLGAGAEWPVAMAVVLGLVLVCAALCCLARAMADDEGDVTPLVLLIPAGVIAFLPFSIMEMLGLPGGWQRWLDMGHAAVRSVNGMESALTLAAFGSLAWAYVALPRDRKGAVLLGGIAACLTLARLDHGIFVVALLGVALLRPDERRFAFTAGVVFAGVLLVYLSINRLYAGTALPISGSIKSSFPGGTDSNWELLDEVVKRRGRTKYTRAQRLFPMLVPAAAAALYLVVQAGRWLWRFRTGSALVHGARWNRFAVASALGALGLAVYDFEFVSTYNLGWWYFPVSSVLVSVFAVDLIVAIPSMRHLQRSLRFAAPIALALAAATYFQYQRFLPKPSRRPTSAENFFFAEAPAVRKFYAGRPIKLVEFDDGIIAYSTGFPALSGFGFALDKEFVDESGGVETLRDWRRARLDVAASRGYDRFATFVYSHGRVNAKSSSRGIRRAYQAFIKKAPRHCRFKVEYASKRSSFRIIRFDCKKRPRKG